MRRTHYLGLIAAFAVAQGALIYGCSADAGAPIEDPVDAAAHVEPDATTDDAPVVVDEDTGTTVIPDAGKKETSVQDAAKEATTRADTGAPGTPCSPVGKNETQPCGRCGTQSRVCESAGADAGGLWSIWGLCTAEYMGADSCDPTQADGGTEACGNCGTRIRLCQPDCKVAQGIVCQGEPPNACTPGDSTFSPQQGCLTAGEGRIATCQANCTLGAPGPCVPAPPNTNTMTVSATAGGVATKKFTFVATAKIARLKSDMACPVSGVDTSITPYIYVELKNPTARALTVSVWHTKNGTGPTDTIMVAYAGAVPPSDTNLEARKACVGYSDDDCTSAVPTACVGFSSAGLMIDDSPSHAVSIPAGGSLTIYNSVYATSSVGDFNLNTRTEN